MLPRPVQHQPKRLLSTLPSLCSSCPLWSLAFLGAVLLWAAFPPLDYGLLAWIAPVPWVLLIRRERLDGRHPYWVLWLAGFAFWMGALHWLRLPHWATGFGWVGLSLYFACYIPALVALSRVAVHRLRVPVALAAPIVWTGLELVRAHLLSGMSMASLAHTQCRQVPLIQVSDLAGEFGVSFVVMCIAASLARMLPCDNRRWTLWPLAPAIALLAAVLGYGHLRAADEITSPGLNVAIIQGSIDIQLDGDTADLAEHISRQYRSLSEDAVRDGRKVDLLVWPESMFPWTLPTFDPDATRPSDFPGTESDFRRWLSRLPHSSPAMAEMAQLAKDLGVPLLLGVNTRRFGHDRQWSYTSAAYVGRNGTLLGRYDKNHLVVFGEYMPFAESLPWLEHFTPLTGSAAPGDRFVAWDAAGVCFAPNICYESVLAHVVRAQVNALAAEGREPDVLINLTNDGWFWGSSELDMHLACAVFRAVECRKPFLIAANTGLSAWIDSDGRIVEQGPRRRTKVLLAQPRLDRHRRSWYLRHGDWFAGFCLVCCVGLGLTGMIHRIHIRRQSRSQTDVVDPT
jgi:apolipoprotein N-acyltransferase